MIKRILSIMLTFCMMMSLFLVLSAAAEDNWEWSGADDILLPAEEMTLPDAEETLLGAETRDEMVVAAANTEAEQENAASDWELWNEVIFDSLTSEQYTVGTNENYTNKIEDDALTLEKNTSEKVDWGTGALTVDIPADKPMNDGRFYMELVFETNVTGDGGQLLANWMSGGNYLLTMSAGTKGMNLAAHVSANAEGTGAWQGTSIVSSYTHGSKIALGIVYDTSDYSLMFYQERMPTNGTKYYTRTPLTSSMTQLRVGLQGASSPGEYGRIYSFKVWRIDSTSFMEDYEYLTIDKVTDEPANTITKNIKELPTVLPNGTRVEWTSSNESVVALDGTVTPAADYTQVTLTAKLDKGGLTEDKKFILTVIPTEKSSQYCYIDRDTFDEEEEIRSWTCDTRNGDYNWESATKYTDTTCVFMKRKADNPVVYHSRYFVTSEAPNRFAITGDVVVEYKYRSNTNLKECTMELLDIDGNSLVDVMFTENGTTTKKKANLTVGYYDGNENVRTPIVKNNHSDDVTYWIRYAINTETGALSVSIDDVVLAEGYVKNNAKNIDVASLRIAMGWAGATAGGLRVDDVSIMVATENSDATKIALDKANYLSFDDIKKTSRNRQDAVIENLKLSGIHFRLGTEIVSWSSSNEAVLSNTGVVTRGSADQPVTLTATLKNGDAMENVDFPIIVKGMNENNLIATEGKVTASSGSSTERNAKDGQMDTAWTALVENPNLQIAFEEATLLSRVILHEKDTNGVYLVTGFVIEASDNAVNWKTVAEGTTVGNNLVIDFEPLETNYIRYRVTSMDQGYTGLYEIEGYYDPTDEYRVKADLTWLKSVITGSNVSGALDLPTVGKFGSVIHWESSNTAVLSNDGKVFVQPEQDTQFTLTATVSSNQYAEHQAFHKKATGTGNGGSSGNSPSNSGSSGKGSALSGSGGLVNVIPDKTAAPISTPTPTPTDLIDSDRTFHDVPKESWSYEYVEILAEKGIVSGYNGAFYPNESVTREEFVKMLLGALEIEATETETNFNDVNTDEWYAPYVATAAKAGIVSGIGDEMFGVGQTITREDMAVMVGRALERSGKNLPTGIAKEFKDSEMISDYAKESVDTLTRADIISGDENNQFNPQDDLTREQAAKIICISGGINNEK